MYAQRERITHSLAMCSVMYYFSISQVQTQYTRVTRYTNLTLVIFQITLFTLARASTFSFRRRGTGREGVSEDEIFIRQRIMQRCVSEGFRNFDKNDLRKISLPRISSGVQIVRPLSPSVCTRCIARGNHVVRFTPFAHPTTTPVLSLSRSLAPRSLSRD